MTIRTTDEAVQKISALSNSLQTRFNSFINLPEPEFFIGIADYIQYVTETPELNVITLEIIQKREDSRKKLIELEQKLAEEIHKTEVEVVRSIQRKHIESPQLINDIREYSEIKDGRTKILTKSQIEALYEGLQDIISTLFYNGYKDLVRHLVASTPDDTDIAYYTIAESYQPYLKESESFKHLEKTSIWASWYQLLRVYRVIHQRQELEDKDFWRKTSYSMLSSEMNEILKSNTKGEPRFFKKDKYSSHLSRIHIYLTDFLLNAVEVAKSEKVKKDRDDENPQLLGSYKLIFTPEDGITHYRGADYQFSGKSKALLAFLNKSKNTSFSLEEIKMKCNPHIPNNKFHFKGDKDMRDTVSYIRKFLKVNKGEFFPIQKWNNNWIWVEK